MIPNEKMYKKGMRVWIPHPNKVWETAIILEDFDADQNTLFILTDLSRETKIITINSSAQLPPFYLSEDSLLDTKSNLSSLTVIHEATILQILRMRFEQFCNYSYCGVSTIALNSYFRLSVNESDEIWKYRKSNLNDLKPHVFAVAESLYSKLERENCDQTIVFTGESGSGKSFNAQRVISYLTTVSSKEVQVRETILISSVILRAFGHAITTLNNDSSRFGKFVQIQYDKNYHVIGALLTAYNLDRSKIVSQGNNFNIFYYMYAAKETLFHLHLNDCKFNYLTKETDVKAYNEHNRRYFDETIDAFNELGVSEKENNEILRILAVLLHLQSIEFKKVEGVQVNTCIESCTIGDQNHLKILGKVLGFDEEVLQIMRKWMCYKRIFCDQDEILQPMNLEQAIKARDALAKCIYTKLFNWLVARMNSSFRSPCHVQSFIGILDMPGFEKLEANSFEQFCINYVDEKVQQLFILSTFKLEQEEYVREEIGWESISFSDNMSCLELIDGRIGILDLLEEETKMSSENSLSWLENLHLKFDKAQNFVRTTESIADFTIHHFICSVQYDANEFLVKNYEGGSKEQLEVLKETKIELLGKFIVEELAKLHVPKVKRIINAKRRSSFSYKASKKTVTAELRASLAVLSATLGKTKTCFVRCIKSNDEKKPFTFDSQRVIEQLRAFNVCETIEISAVGYFQQKSYKKFMQRYHCLCEFKDVKQENRQEVCEKIIVAYREKDDVKFGKTKVFLREDTVQYLEKVRAERRKDASIVIQKFTRRFLQQKRYNEIRRLTYGIQRHARGYLVRQRVQAIHDRVVLEHQSAIKIQACFRGYLHYRWFQFIKYKLPIPLAYADQVNEYLGSRFYSEYVAATSGIDARADSSLARTYENSPSAQQNIQPGVLKESIETNLDFLQDRINCLMSMHLYSEDLESVNSIVDNQTCVQTKNRMLNELLFKKIKNLQALGANRKPCDNPQVQQSQHETDNQPCGVNWRSFDKPVVKQYNDKELYQKLYAAFQKVDRDAKTLQQTAGIDDIEISKLMESYRNSIKASKTPEIVISDAEENNHSKNDDVLKEPIWEEINHLRSDPRYSTNPQEPNSTIDTKDLEELNPYLFPHRNKREEEQDFDPEEESIRMAKKAYRLKLFFDEAEASEEFRSTGDDVKSEDFNRCSSPTMDIAVPVPEVIDPARQAAERFRLIMFGDENDSFGKAFINNVAYNDMFEFNLKDTANVIHELTDVHPINFGKNGVSPDLPAQILMMCIRYADYKNDYLAALSLLHNFIKTVRHIVQIHEVFYTGVFWFVNMYQLLNYLKQYSKPNKKYRRFYWNNDTRQNQQRLRNIDLYDTWITLEQTCRYFVNRIIKEMKSYNIALYSVRALLHAETIYGTKSNKIQDEQVEVMQPTVDVLLNELTTYYDYLVRYSVDRQMIIQIFEPIFSYINSVTLDNFLSHSELCSVSRSIQIRYSLRNLERWAIDRRLSVLIPLLSPIIQAVLLLQSQPISQNDIIYVYKTYDQLSCKQIVKILELYNTYCASEMPASYDQVSISPKVIGRFKEKLEDQENLDDTIIVDLEEYPIKFPFRHSRVKLEEVKIPQQMGFSTLKKR